MIQNIDVHRDGTLLVREL